MTTAVAAPPVTAALPSSAVEHPASTRSYPPIAPSGSTLPSATPTRRSNGSSSHSPPTMSEPQLRRTSSDGKSPNASRTPHVPKVLVKKEPTSPDMRSSRHRPSRLNLASSNMSAAPGALSGRPSAGPLTSKESGSLAMHEVGLACLSPGFNTQDPAMREQLQRSMSVRDQQRQIIEARQKGLKAPGDTEPPRNPEGNLFRGNGKTPSTSRRKGPPPGLSITAPAHEQFANERVVQSAPLGQTFTGLRQNIQPLSRQLVNQPSSLSNTSHIHHVPATQTNNRLPPIADVFPGELQQGTSSSRNNLFPHSPGHSSHSNTQPPIPSPGYPPQHASYPAPQTSRPREYKSAEEAMQSMTGGREDLLPRVVHYGGHQPPTPPSPLQKNVGLGVTAPTSDLHRSGGSKRRDRDEYEKDVDSPPLGRGPAARRGPFGEGRDSPQTIRRKKERFMELCSEAWDLFHS